MKLKIIIFLLASIFIYAGNIALDSFTAKSDGSTISVEWRLNTESNIQSYEIERSNDNNSFKKIYSQKSKNEGIAYKYLDQDAFMKKDPNGSNQTQSNVYSYRIRINYADNTSSYSDIAYVTHSVNSIQRTWGTLKEMFK